MQQHAADKFERRDPFPQIPFHVDEFDNMPSLAELIGWIVLFAATITLCFFFLGLV